MESRGRVEIGEEVRREVAIWRVYWRGGDLWQCWQGHAMECIKDARSKGIE